MTAQVNECTTGDVVGELALLYNVPRGATVIARSDSSLWRMGRKEFRQIIASESYQKLQEVRPIPPQST